MSKQLATLILIAGFVIVLLVLVAVSLNPLRQSEANVTAWLFERTPRGSELQEVRSYAEKQGWFNPDLQGNMGPISDVYLRGELGRYWSIPFFTHVTAFWEFDSSNRLVNIQIKKTQDGL